MDSDNVVSLSPGAQLRAWREQQRVSRAELAARSGASEFTIKAYERDKSFPGPSICDKLFELTELPFFHGHGDASRPIRRTNKGVRGRWKRRSIAVGAIPKLQKDSDASILRLLLLEGKSPEEIGEALGYKPSVSKLDGREIRRHKSIRKRIRRILGVEEFRVLHGDVMSGMWFRDLWSNLGEPSHKQFGANLGTGERHVWNTLRKKEQKLLTSELCERIRDCERNLIGTLMRDRGRVACHFKSVVPDLNSKLKTACEAIARFRDFSETSSTQQDEMLNVLANEARKDPTARKILVLLPTLIPWLYRNQAELDRRVQDVAVLFLALDYGVKGWIVHQAAHASIEATPKGEIRALLFPLASHPVQRAVRVAEVHAPRPKKFSERLLEKGRFCVLIAEEAKKIRHLSVDGGLTIAEIKQRHPGFSIWEVREELSAEDREHFNHPRQWGPVVGYAVRILSKQQGKSEATIEEWMKGFRKSQRNA